MVMSTSQHLNISQPFEVAVTVEHLVGLHRDTLALYLQHVERSVAVIVAPGVVHLVDVVATIVLNRLGVGVTDEEGCEVIVLKDVEQLRALLLRPPLQRPRIEAVVLHVDHGLTVGSVFLQVVGNPLHVALAVGGVAGSELSAHEVNAADVDEFSQNALFISSVKSTASAGALPPLGLTKSISYPALIKTDQGWLTSDK